MYKDKNIITADISTIKIHNKKDRKNMLNFFFKFFTYTLLIWILQCFDNRSSYKSWSYKNNFENIHSETIRSLAESRKIKNPTNEGSKVCSMDPLNSRNMEDLTTESFESRMRQRDNKDQLKKEIAEIEEKIDIEKENMMQKEDKTNKEKFYEGILGTIKSNTRLATLYTTLFLTIIGLIVKIFEEICFILRCSISYFQLSVSVILLSAISLILLLIVIIRDEKETIDQNEL